MIDDNPAPYPDERRRLNSALCLNRRILALLLMTTLTDVVGRVQRPFPLPSPPPRLLVLDVILHVLPPDDPLLVERRQRRKALGAAVVLLRLLLPGTAGKSRSQPLE